MESGMRWSFSRRGNTDLSDYPIGSLGKFNLNYPSITDAEVAVLRAFMATTKGRYHAFRFLDPSGNLLKYSEDFSAMDWIKSGISYSPGQTDPFGGDGNLASLLTGSYSNSYLCAQIGSSNGLSGFIINTSVWLKGNFPGQTVGLSLIDINNPTAPLRQNLLSLSTSWARYSMNVLLWDNTSYGVMLGGAGTWADSVYVYGFQVAPSKGECAYTRSPDNYGDHANVRFDTDTFTYQGIGPNQNSVSLPCVEYFPGSSGSVE
jgi:hypothetical protein